MERIQCFLIITLILLAPAIGYEFIAGYLYWYPHQTDNLNAVQLQGSVNLRAVWNISSFQPPPSKQHCPTYQFSKGSLECNGACVGAVPTVQLQCTDVNLEQGWVSGQMVFPMTITTSQRMKLAYSGIDWPSAQVTDENLQVSVVTNNKLEFSYDNIDNPLPRLGVFPWPIVQMSLSTCYKTAVPIPTFERASVVFRNVTTNLPSYTFSDGAALNIEMKYGKLRFARHVWKHGRWETLTLGRRFWYYSDPSTLVFKFQNDTGMFPVSLAVVKQEQRTLESQIPVMFLLNITGPLQYEVRPSYWNNTYVVNMNGSCLSSCDAEDETVTLQKTTSCTSHASNTFEPEVPGGCINYPAVSPPEPLPASVTSVTSVLVSLSENPADDLPHSSFNRELSTRRFRTYHSLNGTIVQQNLKIADFVHLKSMDVMQSEPQRYSVIQLRPEYDKQLNFVRLSPNRTNCSLPCRIHTLYMEFNQQVFFAKAYLRLNLCPLAVNEYGLPDNPICKRFYYNDIQINANIVQLNSSWRYIWFGTNNVAAVGVWYITMEPDAFKGAFICNQTEGGNPPISDNSTWQLFVVDEYPPYAHCSNTALYSHYYNKSVQISSYIYEPLKSYTCHLSNLDSPSEPVLYPCHLEETEVRLIVMSLNDTFVNQSWYLSISLEDLHGNVANYNDCRTFFVDVEPPSLTLNLSKIPDNHGLDTHIFGHLGTCFDNSKNSSIFYTHGARIQCRLYYQLRQQNSSEEVPWVYIDTVDRSGSIYVHIRSLNQLYFYMYSYRQKLNESGLYHLRFKARDEAYNWSPVVYKTIFVDADYPIISGIENKTMDCSQPNAGSVENNGKPNATDRTSNISSLTYSDAIKNVSLLIRTWKAEDALRNRAFLQQYLWFPNDTFDITVLSYTIHIPCHKAWKFDVSYHDEKTPEEANIRVAEKCETRKIKIRYLYDNNRTRQKCDQERSLASTRIYIDGLTTSWWDDILFKTIQQTLIIGPMMAFYPVNKATKIDYRNGSVNFQWTRHPDAKYSYSYYSKIYKVFVWRANDARPMNATFTTAYYGYVGIEEGYVSYLYHNPSLITFSKNYKWQVVVVHNETDQETGPVWEFSTMAELCIGSCNGNGICVGENQCQCFPRYTGNNCSSCDTGYWGPNCVECPACVSGLCDQTTGSCNCNHQKWVGYLCDECAVGWIGPNCEKLPFTTEIFPDSGPDVGGTLVNVKGYNFEATTNYTCLFDSYEVLGTTTSANLVQCTTPQHPAGYVTVSLKNIQALYAANFLYVVDCGSSDCGAQNTPEQGYCTFGRCVCESLWQGYNCHIPVLKPNFVFHHPQIIREFDEITINITITEGTEPVIWKRWSLPSSATFNESAAVIGMIARDYELLTFEVAIGNTAGDTSKTLNLTVQPAYRIKNITTDVRYLLPKPKLVTLTGEIEIINGQRVPNVPTLPVVFRVQSVYNGQVRRLRALVRVQLNERNFSAIYAPTQGDIGKYIVDAVHPFYEHHPVEEMASWNVLGLTTEPKIVSFKGYVDEIHLANKVCTVINPGSEQLTEIQYQMITTAPEGITIMLSTNESLPQNHLVSSLAPGGSFDLYMSVQTELPLAGRVVFLVTTFEGSWNFIAVNIDAEARKSLLRLDPSQISVAVARGSHSIVTVKISNIGSLLASNVTIDAPQNSGISVLGVGKKDLEIGDSAKATIRFSYPADEPLGTQYGSIYAKSNDNWVELRYNVFITSNNKLDIRVLVEDEYTYFKEDKPPLAGATVELWGINKATSFSGNKQTGSDGLVIFLDVNEGFYNLLVYAEDHNSWRGVVHFSPAEPNKTVFLQREKVKVRFVVKYFPITDKYEIELESSFETSVPMPVVTFSPQVLDLRDYEEGRKNRIDIEVTNHGLIAVNDVKVDFVDDHPFLEFHPNNEILLLPANTSYSISLSVKFKTRAKRSTSDNEICVVEIHTSYTYPCSDVKVERSKTIVYKPCSGPRGFRSMYLFDVPDEAQLGTNWKYGYEVKSSVNCDPLECLRSVGSCLTQGLKSMPFGGCIYQGLAGQLTLAGKLIARKLSSGDIKEEGLDLALACVLDVGLFVSQTAWLKAAFGLISLGSCAVGVHQNCVPVALGMYNDNKIIKPRQDSQNPTRTKRDVSQLEQATRNFVLSLSAVDVLLRSQDAIFSPLANTDRVRFFFGATGITAEELSDNYKFLIKMMKTEFKRLPNETWTSLLLQGIADHSELGNFISDSEQASLIKVAHSLPEQEEYLLRFLSRWNHSMELWQLGRNVSNSSTEIWDPEEITSLRLSVKAALTETERLSYSSIADWAANEYNQYINYLQAYDQSQGVCAVVRVKISQRAVLTRDAFKATLEIENGQSKPLQDILVKLRIWRSGDVLRNSQLQHFAIGSPILSGITSVAGRDSLPTATSASAEWLIIPRQTAVPGGEEKFYVGGIIEYTTDGVKSQTVLAPGPIIVKAQPELHLHYFHEKYIYGDDPFTNDTVEESIPFVLAVMVVNKGNGEARNLKITSAQPDIIENEKGLLIDFEIIGCNVGLNEVDKSLTVDFGTIPPRSVKVAQWLLTSSLNGQFFNLSASFVNINPLGDETLSLIETVSYHELIHVVEKISENNQNFYGDFLANAEADPFSYPETIYETRNGSAVGVGTLDTGSVSVNNLQFEATFDKPELHNRSQWFYGRVYIDKEKAPPRSYVPILFVDENGTSKPLRNAWITYSVKREKPWISILDLIIENQRPNCCTYIIEFGPPHLVPTSTTTTTTVTATTTITKISLENITTSALANETTSAPLENRTTTTSAHWYNTTTSVLPRNETRNETPLGNTTTSVSLHYTTTSAPLQNATTATLLGNATTSVTDVTNQTTKPPPHRYKIMCPPGYQAFHTFNAPINPDRYLSNSPVDCVQFENAPCLESCYWAGESHGRTRGDCSYFWDTMVIRTDIHYEGKKAVYVAGFEFDNNRIDRAYCCISGASLTGKCYPEVVYSIDALSSINAFSEFPSALNPVIRGFDVRYDNGLSSGYAIEVCNTTYANASSKATCSPAGEKLRQQFKVMCPPGYQAFHTFEAPINPVHYLASAAVDCVQFEDASCVESCYWAGESHGRTRGDCSYFWDTLVMRKDIYFESRKAVYVGGFEFDGRRIDRAYCCISRVSQMAKCYNKTTWSKSSPSSFNVTYLYPSASHPVTRSFDVKVDNGTFCDYAIEVCNTTYPDEASQATCSPSKPPGFHFTCPPGFQAFQNFEAPLKAVDYLPRKPVHCIQFEQPSCVESCYWASASHGRTRGDCGYFWDTMVVRNDIYFEGMKAVYVSGFHYNGLNIDQAYCCVSSGSTVGTCQNKTEYNSQTNSSIVASNGIQHSVQFNAFAGYATLTNPITRSFDVKMDNGTHFAYALEVCDTTYTNPTAEKQCKPTGRPDPRIRVTCPPGYQAFHTFSGPVDTLRYIPAAPTDCVKFENPPCTESCYWASWSHANRTRGDCSYFWDTLVIRTDIYFEGKKAVYVNGFEFDGASVDRAYCCISNASLVDSCATKVTVSTLQYTTAAAMVNVSALYPASRNPITRSMDIKMNNGTYFDYVLEVCNTTYVDPQAGATCAP